MASSGLGSAALRASQIWTGVSVLLSMRTWVLQGLAAVIVSCTYFDKELAPIAATRRQGGGKAGGRSATKQND